MSVSTTSYPNSRSSVSSTSWQEPHPGQKLAFSTIVPGGQGANHGDSGDNNGRDSTVGTLESPVAQNLDVLSPTQSVSATSMSSRRNAEAIGTPLDSGISPDDRSVGSVAISEAHSSALTTTHTLQVDVDMDRYNKMEMDESQVTEVLPSPALSTYSDVSNYLDYPGEPEEMYGVVSTAYNASFVHMAPCDDLYGWNAEWDRRLPSPLPSPPSGERQAGGQSLLHRRGRRSKHNLLGRVLGVGRTPSRIRP